MMITKERVEEGQRMAIERHGPEVVSRTHGLINLLSVVIEEDPATALPIIAMLIGIALQAASPETIIKLLFQQLHGPIIAASEQHGVSLPPALRLLHEQLTAQENAAKSAA
jgi:hypothetical protein